MKDVQRGATVSRYHPVSNMRQWNNCFIYVYIKQEMLLDLLNFVCKDGQPKCDFVAAISRVWYNPGYNGILGGLGTGAASRATSFPGDPGNEVASRKEGIFMAWSSLLKPAARIFFSPMCQCSIVSGFVNKT